MTTIDRNVAGMTHDHIRVIGVREHNLKDVSVDIPKQRLTVVTGVSGSGKSSLIFDTIAAESARQLNETFAPFVRNRLPRYGRPEVEAIENLSAAIVVDQKRLGGNARSTVGTITDIYSLMRLLWSRAGRPYAGDSTTFSFNDPQGRCPECDGLGTTRTVDVDRLVDRRKSLDEGPIRFPTFQAGGWTWRTFAESGLFDTGIPLADYTEGEWRALIHGTNDLEGVLQRFQRIWLRKDPESMKGRTREAFERVVTQDTCPLCHGARLSPAVLSCRINGRNIAECAALEAEELVEVIKTIDEPAAAPMVAALVAQLERLIAIGLGYLTMDRPTSSLSGGESQRVKMVRHLGSSLTDLTYIFDEPSIGLHPHDVVQLTELLASLRDKGNTVLVVEHDPDVIAVADHVIDLGPGAGRDGGQIVYQGDVAGLAHSYGPTGRHLKDRPSLRQAPRRPTGQLEIRGATRNNLHNVDVDVPTGVLTVVTGVAGSGKSTLIRGFLPTVDEDVTIIDQGAIRGSRRSSPATYTGILEPIRDLFATENGVDASLFSPNADGACPRCNGLGVIYTDLAFMDPMVSVCERCEGRRFTEDVLRYRLRGLTIADALDLSAHDALGVFPEVRSVLERLEEVGLGYLALGRPTNTLSGGERQRLKLADELDRRGTGCEARVGVVRDRGEGAPVHVFDEPTTGLHMADVAGLVELLDRLVERGSTVVVIEHNLDVISQADWIIDLGPGPGRHGGRVLFQGTPHDLARAEGSVTAHHLRRVLAAA
jgi:excinuclease UvrABC ATPase subunit